MTALCAALILMGGFSVPAYAPVSYTHLQTAAYSVEIWKRFRKWGGIPTAITQNIKDLLASREVENIFENSDFVLMLNQAQGDRAILAKQLNICLLYTSYIVMMYFLKHGNG